MQIHELDTYIGTPSSSDYLAVDDGTETMKIPITDVGVTTEMTTDEAEAGTVEDPRVITPKVLHDYAESVAVEYGVIEVSESSVSSLPVTISDADIRADHVCIKAVLSNPSAQTDDWTVTTSSGSAVISGSISGTTDVTLYLAVKTN